MNAHRALIIIALGVLSAPPAWADKPAYCAAYARDFADARAKDKDLWQHKYDIALADCLDAPQQKVAAAPMAKKKASAKVKTAEVAKPEPAPTAAPKLLAGSADWNIYCANKYASFNVKTGTYLSKTGVARKCLVSAN